MTNAKKSFDRMTQVERENLDDGKPLGHTSELKGKVSLYDYDDALKATIEMTPTGERYVVMLEGGVLARVRQL